MSSRLAFQTQLASIMEVLANAAVAEICKLVDDDYAVVSLQMSQCQRENKALKRKLHLLELKMARGNAERRLRESAMNNNNRPRLQFNSDRPRQSSPSTDGGFERQMEVALWSSGTAAVNAPKDLIQSNSTQSKSPDVELVEPEAVLVKEEKMDMNVSAAKETEEDVALIGDDGVVEHVPRGAAGQSVKQQDTQSASCQVQNQSSTARRSSSSSSSNSRGAESQKDEQPDVVLVKVEGAQPVMGTLNQTDLSIQEGLVESSTDDYRAALPLDETTQTSSNQLPDLQESGRGFSEPAAPQLTAATSQDPSSVVMVQLRVPDTNSPSSPSNRHQHKSSNIKPLSSEYSLFELETFFTRWAPDGDSVSTLGGPSASFTADDSADSEQDGVIIVEAEPQTLHGRTGGGQSFSSASDRSRVHSQPSVSQAPLRMQAPTWSGPSTTLRRPQAQLLLQLQHHDGNSSIPQQQLGPSDDADKTSISSISSISSTSRTMSSSVAPCSALPARANAAFSSIGAAMAAQHQISLLARHNKRQADGLAPGERRRKSYICRACGKAFPGLSNLEAHERVHTGEKPFRCDTCGKQFSEAGNLKKHQRVHTGEKPFSCDLCGKRFAWICNLRTHQQSATGCGPQARGGLGLG
ncbi:uncharacterized protein V6R79_022345 [Siganus canaliculatus]